MGEKGTKERPGNKAMGLQHGRERIGKVAAEEKVGTLGGRVERKIQDRGNG